MAAISPRPAGGQSTCPPGSGLPAYAHNDYANHRPLHQALELGYRGVEADVFLRQGELRVGHDAGATRSGRNLESLYLRPLRTILQQCGHILPPPTPFLLNVELKERSRPAYDSLLALVGRYGDLFGPLSTHAATRPVEIILVGWYPEPADPDLMVAGPPWRQQRITSLSRAPAARPASAIRLLSLDYGKTIKWSGRGPPPQRAADWLARIREAKAEGAGRLARAYNVPIDTAVYRLLLSSGVDLIGTKRLSASRRVLLTLRDASIW